MKYGHKLLISVVGLGFFNYAVLWKIYFFYFLETFTLGPLFQLDCCHSVLTRHDTLSQNDVFPQNSIMRAIIQVSGCNQTHPYYYVIILFLSRHITIFPSLAYDIRSIIILWGCKKVICRLPCLARYPKTGGVSSILFAYFIPTLIIYR